MTLQEPNYPYTLAGEVHVLARCPDQSTIAAGYSNGDVCIFNYISKTLVATLHGHRSSVNCLAFDSKGLILVSGSADTDIFIWDMMTLSALGRLTGHKDGVTGVAVLNRETQPLIVSVSKDTLMKVWDIESQQCIQTIVGHRCEIWSLVVTTSGRVITGSSDDIMRGYRLTTKGSSEVDASNGSEENILEYYGAIRRGSTDKCASLVSNSQGNLLAAQSSGKIVEVTTDFLFLLKSI